MPWGPESRAGSAEARGSDLTAASSSIRRFDRAAGEAGRGRRASRRWTTSGFTAVGGVAASINEIRNIVAISPGARGQTGRLVRSCGEPDEPPERRGGRSLRGSIDSAPLPEGYDPHALGKRQVYACVQVGHEGRVLAVRMLSGTGHQARDSSLIRTIRRS